MSSLSMASNPGLTYDMSRDQQAAFVYGVQMKSV